MSSQQLLAELQQDNLFFDHLVDMIPTKLYIAGHSGDDYNPKYFKGQSKESKEARRAKNKQAKRTKLHPALSETTTQVQQRLEQEQSKGNKRQLPGPPQIPPTSAVVVKNGSKASAALHENSNKSRIEALREKLHAKLAEKRALRPNSDPSAVSKRAARKLEKEKRREEAAAAKKRKKKATSNAEGKSSTKKFKLSTDLHNDKGATADLAQVDFGILAGLNPINTSNYIETNKALRNLSKTKNLEKMLADAEAKKQRLEELKQSGTEEDKQKAANMEWGNAIKEANGERVKDDPAKLKKALKRKVIKKQKSAKAWKARMEQTQQKMDERQKIRNHNLSKRKMGGSAGANLSKKRIVTEESAADAGKKAGKEQGRRLSRPGFEGRKQDFLNKKNGAKQQ
jgi:DNA excision repair protein ERCC-4